MKRKRSVTKKGEIQELPEFIRDNLLTKDEHENSMLRIGRRFDTLEAQMKDIKTGVRDIRRLEVLGESVRNTSGYSKEIDHLIESGCAY